MTMASWIIKLVAGGGVAVQVARTLLRSYSSKRRSKNPRQIRLSFPHHNGPVVTAQLLWEQAPLTCKAIVDALPFNTVSWHGRNSGAEALCLTPSVIYGIPQDATENAKTDHKKGMLCFGVELAGQAVGGAGSDDASEIAWFFGEHCQAQYWVSESGPPHTKGPYRRQTANLNHFAQVDESFGVDAFYRVCGNLPHLGDTKIKVEAIE
jgi:hypothetical protein